MASPRVKRLLLSGLPSWIPRASGIPAPLVFDFVGQRSYVLGQWGRPENFLTVSSSANGWYLTPSGLWVNAAANTLRYQASSSTLAALGVLPEEARTNVCLWNRDLTNGAWVAVNVTAAKTQVGIDGVTNSASSITSTAGNGTILQTIVLASSARMQSAFVKRITGTGTVNMTTDGGLTWTAITVTSAFTQVTVPTQTLANPIVGFQIVTSGDAIAVDMVQNENGTFVTSPIATTTASVARTAEAISMTLPTSLQSLSAYALLVSFIVNGHTTGIFNVAAQIDDNSQNNRCRIGESSGDVLNSTWVTGAASQANMNHSAPTLGAVNKILSSAAVNDFISVHNGGAALTDASGTMPTGITTLHLGTSANTQQLNGTLVMGALWPFRVPTSEAQRLTT